MKLKLIGYCLIGVLFYLPASSQRKKIAFHTLAKAGIASGKSGIYGSFNLINGVANKKWFAGAGAGYDYYRYKTIPLFFSIERYLGRQNEILLNADLGYNFPTKNKPGKEVFYYSSYHFTGGFYSALSFGYRIKLYNKASFLLSTGYTYKKISTKVGVINPCLIGPCPEEFSNYDYDFGTITIKGGIDLKW